MIQIDQLNKSYSGVIALSNICLSLNEGELFGLIGPDGAGKTTLFRILTSLLLPDSGKASVMGLDTVKDFKTIRAEVGYMPGKFSLYQDLTVEENLRFFAHVFNTSIDQNKALIHDIYVQIEPFKHRRAGNLSGGMKQKLALCCALIHKPKVLFLDEPTTGVDPVSRKEFWEMLQQIKSQGVTIMVSTPYMDEAVLCDRIALIQKGCILSVNTPQSISQAFPKVLYGLQSDHNYLLMQYLRKQAIVETCYMFGSTLHLTLACSSNSSLAYIQQQVVNEGYFVSDWTEITPSIEDCFIRLLGQMPA